MITKRTIRKFGHVGACGEDRRVDNEAGNSGMWVDFPTLKQCKYPMVDFEVQLNNS